MKRVALLFVCTLLVMTSCTPKLSEDEEVLPNDEESQGQPSIVPSNSLSDQNYRIILPYRTSEARGVIVNQIANRLDIDEMEVGLRRHSKEYFDPKKYFFEEGQYLDEDTVYDWLGRDLTDEQLEQAVEDRIAELEYHGMTVNEDRIREELTLGLNPAIEDDEDEDQLREKPRYLSHILEHNFLVKNEDKTVDLRGVSIGVALKSVYRFKADPDGPDYYEDIPESEMVEKGKEIAQTILERAREIEGLEEVPIMIALYREEAQGSTIPGNFVTKTLVPKGENTIKEWNDINEEYILFPSNEAEKKYYDDAQIVKSFGNDIAKFFPNYVGVIGEGFYVNEEMQKLTLEVPIEFHGEGEVLGFAQYAYDLVKEMFPDYYDLEVKITSSDQIEGVIYREAGQSDPDVRIFH
ncbi:Protein involved in sex pheromone biosynthesis [Oceanobacillus limi]|uniref:Protein involved in sex pheromone biosynthesis n=1 Tax=Oceanobacillus limi TaxID=930131 RepID=A0A1I0E2J0_9BACI|nr:CamS family sex pheromone protein [Oceanobacillus limi]SET39276.1 Protein involved in sex pheromone biosynthesis [Oceanobacillus limi]